MRHNKMMKIHVTLDMCRKVVVEEMSWNVEMFKISKAAKLA